MQDDGSGGKTGHWGLNLLTTWSFACNVASSSCFFRNVTFVPGETCVHLIHKRKTQLTNLFFRNSFFLLRTVVVRSTLCPQLVWDRNGGKHVFGGFFPHRHLFFSVRTSLCDSCFFSEILFPSRMSGLSFPPFFRRTPSGYSVFKGLQAKLIIRGEGQKTGSAKVSEGMFVC